MKRKLVLVAITFALLLTIVVPALTPADNGISAENGIMEARLVNFEARAIQADPCPPPNTQGGC